MDHNLRQVRQMRAFSGFTPMRVRACGRHTRAYARVALNPENARI